MGKGLHAGREPGGPLQAQVSTPTSPSGLLGEGASLPLRSPINELIHRAEATVLLGQLLTL